MPGDIGIYSAGDGFRKLFNLWDDAASLNKSARLFNEPAYLPPARSVEQRRRILREGDTVVQGGTSTTLFSKTTDGRVCVFELSLPPEKCLWLTPL